MHVFVSYNRVELDFAENVISRLEKEGFVAWADFNIGVGEEWRNSIDIAIRNSFALIVIMSPEAKESEYVTYEWALAWGAGIKVIPVMVRPTQLHPRLEALQYLDFTNDRSRPWARLIEEVRVASHAQLAHSISVPLNAPPIVRRAVAALDSVVGSERAAAVETLRTAQTPASAVVLRNTLKHPLPDVRAAVAEALANGVDPADLPAMIDALDDPEPEVRRAVVRALGWRKDPALTTILIGSLKDPDSDVRAAAVEVLGTCLEPAVTSALIERLNDADGAVRRSAVNAIAERHDPAVTTALIASLQDADVDTRLVVVDALAPRQGPAVTTALVNALRDPYVRGRAVDALRRAKEPACVSPLLHMLEDVDAGTCRASALALGELSAVGCLDDASHATLAGWATRALKDSNRNVRSAAASVLGMLRDVTAVAPLLEALKDPFKAVRRNAAVALATINDAGAVQELIRALDDPDSAVRASAADALGVIKDPSATPALAELRKDPDDRVRSAAARAIEEIRR